jgi:hypothetical protein
MWARFKRNVCIRVRDKVEIATRGREVDDVAAERRKAFVEGDDKGDGGMLE